MRKTVLTIIAATTLLGGCEAFNKGLKQGDMSRVAAVSEPAKPYVGNVYLMRGLVGVFSVGMDQLGVKLNDAGIRAQVYQGNQRFTLAKKLIDSYGKSTTREPLVLVGHSYGADDVVRVARDLDAANVPIDLVITVDPTTPPPMPKNVRLAINLYQSNGAMDAMPWLRGIAVKQDKDRTAPLYNWNIRTDRKDLLDDQIVNHFNIEKKTKIHDECIRQIKQICVTRETWARQQFHTPAVLAIAPPPATRPMETAHSDTVVRASASGN